MSRFSQALQGKTGRYPKAAGKAVLLIGVGIGYSRIFYPQPLCLPRSESALRVTMQLEEIPDTSLAAGLCRRILRAQAMTAAARQKGATK